MNMFGKIIVIKRNGADGAHFPLTSSACLFGRGQDCDIRIQMPNVDTEQCIINVNDKGHVLMRNVSTGIPTLLNEKALSNTMTPLSHGDIITIVDRKFRFEFPVDSRFYPKSPRGKSPKSPRNTSAIDESVVGFKSPVTTQQRSPKPLSPRTDNVPVSEVYSKSPQKQMITNSLKDVLTNEVNTSANYSNDSSKLPMSPASFYNSTPKGLKRLSEVPQNKVTPTPKMTPGTSHQLTPTTSLPSPARRSGSGLYTRTHESLQKSIKYLKRRSMPLVERDEETNVDVLLPEESVTNKSVSQATKRKLSSFEMLSAKRKRVSFGPSLSPEHFDKTLPPKTPIKKGATPTRVNQGRKSLLKRNSPKTPKNTPTPRKASPGGKGQVTPSVENLDSSSQKQNSAKKLPGKRLSAVASPLSQGGLAQESKHFATPDRVHSRTRSMSPASKGSAELVTPSSSRKENRSKSMSPTSKGSAEPVTPSSSRKENRSSPKATLGSPSQSYLTDSPLLSQDLFSQRSPIVAENSLISDKTLSSGKKKTLARAKSEGPIGLKNLAETINSRKRVGSLGTSPSSSPLIDKSTIKVKNVRLSGISPLSGVHYEKTPIVKRAGKLSVQKSESSLDISLTGIKELFKTQRANQTKTGILNASDLFASPVHTTTRMSSVLNKSVGSLVASSNAKPRSLRKSPADTPKRQSAGSSFSGLSRIFKTPQDVKDVSSDDSIKLSKTIDTPRPIPLVKRNNTPKDLANTPSHPADITFFGVSHLFKTPIEDSDDVDGNKQTVDSVTVVDTPIHVASGRKSRTPKKLLGSHSEDIFYGMSELFRSPDPHLDNKVNNLLDSSKSVSSKKKTPKSNAHKTYSADTSFSGVSELFKTPGQQRNVAKVNSTSMFIGSSNAAEEATEEKSSSKRNRTPKKFFDEISPVSAEKKNESFQESPSNTKSLLKTPMSQMKSPLKTPMSQKKSPLKTPMSQKKSPLKTPMSQKKSPLKTPMSQKKSPVQTEKLSGKIQSPPQDRNKVVALRVIHGHSLSPKVHTKTPSRTPKSIKKSAAMSAKKTIRMWSDIVKTGVSKPTATVKPSLFSSTAAVMKKKPGPPLKHTVKTPKTPRALARALAPSTGHAESPATILVGKRVATKSKTPVPIPRKGRKQAVGKMSRISVGNTSFTGLSDLYKTPEPAQLADVSALYDQIPDTPNGPNEMFVSPLAGAGDKRRSINLTGVRELFAQKKRQSMVLTGVRELMASPQRIMTTMGSTLAPKLYNPSPNNTPSGLKRMMKVPTYASPYGVENLFREVENETPKSSKKSNPPKTLQMNSPTANAALSGNDKIISPKPSATKQHKVGTKRKADANTSHLEETQPGLNIQEQPEKNLAPVSKRLKKGTTVDGESIQSSLPVATEPVLRKGRGKSTEPDKTVENVKNITVSPVKETKTSAAKKLGQKGTEESVKKELVKQNSRLKTEVPGDVPFSKLGIASPKPKRGRVKFVDVTAVEVSSDMTSKSKQVALKKVKDVTKSASGNMQNVEPSSRKVKGKLVEPSTAETDAVEVVRPTRGSRGKPTPEVDSVAQEAKTDVKGKRGKKNDAKLNLMPDVLEPVVAKSTRTGRSQPMAEVDIVAEVKTAVKGKRGKRNDAEHNLMPDVTETVVAKSTRTGRSQPIAEMDIIADVKTTVKGKRGKKNDAELNLMPDFAEPVVAKSTRTGRSQPIAKVDILAEVKTDVKGKRGKRNNAELSLMPDVAEQVVAKSTRTGRSQPIAEVDIIAEVKTDVTGKRGKRNNAELNLMPDVAEQVVAKSTRTGRSQPIAEVDIIAEVKTAVKSKRAKRNDAELNLMPDVAEPVVVKSTRTGRIQPIAEVDIIAEVKSTVKGKRGKRNDAELNLMPDVAEPVVAKSTRTGRSQPIAKVDIAAEVKTAAKGKKGKSNNTEPDSSTMGVAEPVVLKSSRTGRGKAAATILIENNDEAKMDETDLVNPARTKKGMPDAPINQQLAQKPPAKERKRLQPTRAESPLEAKESLAKPTANTNENKTREKNAATLKDSPEEQPVPVKKSRGKTTIEPIAEAVSVQTGRKGRSKVETGNASGKTVDLIAKTVQPLAAVKVSATTTRRKRKQVEPVVSSPIVVQKAGTRRALKNQNTDSETISEAVPAKRSKKSAPPAESSTKPTKASKKTFTAKQKENSVKLLKSELDVVPRSTRARRK